MTLKKFIPCLSLLFFVVVSLQSYANPDDDPTPDNGPDLTLKRVENPKHHRPNTPDVQFITCSYHNGVLTLNFAEPEGVCRGSISDLTYGTYQFITFDSDELNVDITTGPLTDFTIEFTTAHGNTYTGSTQK